MQIAPAPKPPTPAPIQPVSVPKSRIPVTPVVTLPDKELRIRVSLLIQIWSLKMNREVRPMVLLLFQVFQ